MAIHVQCPSCRTAATLADSTAGKRVRCNCGVTFVATTPVIVAPKERQSDGQWYYESNGKRVGPVSEARISELIRDARIDRGTVVWQEGLEGWIPVESSSLRGYLVGPPPLTGEAVDNTLVWVLAFAPFIGVFVQGFLAGASNKPISDYWWATLVLNIILSYADESKLKHAGHDTSKMGSWFLVPIYLYNRSEILKQGKAYFVVWLVLFILVLLGQ